MKSSAKKKGALDLHRPSIASVISASGITEESLNTFKTLPEELKLDPSLLPFRKRKEELGGNFDRLKSVNNDSLDNDAAFKNDIESYPNGSNIVVQTSDE